MKQTSGPAKKPAEAVIKDIRRATRRQFSSEEKIRVVLEGLRGEDSIAELCRREGIAASMYYGWSKEFLEAGKKRLSGDTARAATTDEVRDLRREAGALKEVVADLVLENRLLKRMARPVCKVVNEGACDRSAQTYPACRHGGRRQDGEPHVPGLISNSASGAAFFA
ncbi:transposase, partial [Methylobacterium sp. WL2]|uniref:transposase n=1 Tax=Methylobacterium sp. WL2 TaxID=2603902 RepID=UPI001FEFBBDD